MTATVRELWTTAQEFSGQRQWPAARKAFQELLAQQPGHTPALLQLSYIESLSGSYRLARDYALRAFRTEPSAPKVVGELIARLRTFNEAGMIDQCARRLPPLREVDIRLLLSFAAQFSYLNEQERAMQFLDEAMRGDPDFPPTLLARGQVLTYLGRFDEAERDLQRCIDRAPELAQAHWLLSRLRKVTPTTHHVDRIRASLRRFRHQGDNLALLEYALHKELDDLGDHDEAWGALSRACVAKRATLRYSTEDTRVLVDRLIAMPTRSIPRSVPVEASDGIVPIFIVGMHRSGTTLLEHLLAGHTKVQALGELYDFTSQMRAATDHHCHGVIDTTIIDRAIEHPLDGVGPGYLAGIEWRLHGCSHFTDKLPSNFLNLGFICRALPQAKVLHMVRDPMETAFSNLRELFSGANPYSYDQGELLDYHQHYQRLMKHWHERFPGRILDVDYAALTAEPEATLRAVASFCGLPYQAAAHGQGGNAARSVATASAIQVREKVQLRKVPKWRPYAEHLHVLREGFRPDG